MLRVLHSSPSLSCAAAVAAAAGSFDETLETPVVPVLVLSAAAAVAVFSSAKSEEGAELHAAERAANPKTRSETNDLERVIMGCFSVGVTVLRPRDVQVSRAMPNILFWGHIPPEKELSIFESACAERRI